jgi:hypothetical protein
MGDLSYIKDMPEMYRSCVQEDPDMSIAEFVFEHLPNINNTESNDEGEHEKPHQPTYNHVPAQIMAMPSTIIKLVSIQYVTVPAAKEYPLMLDKEALNCDPLKILRPPIA